MNSNASPPFHKPREITQSLTSTFREFSQAGALSGIPLMIVAVVAIDSIGDNLEKVQPPLQRLEHQLSTQVNYFIMPVFALANAGVDLQTSADYSAFGGLTWYIILSLVVGKMAGISFFGWLFVKLKT